jgi:hypothetical protein
MQYNKGVDKLLRDPEAWKNTAVWVFALVVIMFAAWFLWNQGTAGASEESDAIRDQTDQQRNESIFQFTQQQERADREREVSR